MKKTVIVTTKKDKIEWLKGILEDKELVYDDKNPDFVISLGGDGTLLEAERCFPNIPKLLIRDSKTCNKCVGDDEQTILDLVRENKIKIDEYSKVKAKINDIEIVGANDITLRNKKLNQAIRFDIKGRHVIGDGVVVSTVFGSTGYYKAITRTDFDKGYGVAFSNPTQPQEPLNFEDEIKLDLVRGNAEVAADNDEKVYILKEGESITFMKSEDLLRIIRLEGLE